MTVRRATQAGAIAGALLLAGAAGIGSGIADEHERVAPVKDALVAKECSACHMLYPAGLLPAPAWQKLMVGLKNHFGDNAELDADATAKITAYLVANAERSSAKATGDEPIRITEMSWFKRKHEKRGRISAETLKRRGAKSAADCKACHTAAEKGYFEDD